MVLIPCNLCPLCHLCIQRSLSLYHCKWENKRTAASKLCCKHISGFPYIWWPVITEHSLGKNLRLSQGPPADPALKRPRPRQLFLPWSGNAQMGVSRVCGEWHEGEAGKQDCLVSHFNSKATFSFLYQEACSLPLAVNQLWQPQVPMGFLQITSNRTSRAKTRVKLKVSWGSKTLNRIRGFYENGK